MAKQQLNERMFSMPIAHKLTEQVRAKSDPMATIQANIQQASDSLHNQAWAEGRACLRLAKMQIGELLFSLELEENARQIESGLAIDG